MPDATNPYSFANEYVKAGWLGPLPLPAGKKHPPPKGFTGVSAPYPSELDLARWLKLSKSNIALRLAEVPGYVPPGCKPVGYELVGLDVDNYGNKTGAKQLAELEAEYGKLPPTLRSSSRWSTGDDSCIYVFLVPAGYKFNDKPKSCIEIIQKRHRYMVVWPSINPDADNETYRWKAKDGAYREVPILDDVAVLPDAWIDFLTNGRQNDAAEDVSDLDYGELVEWAKANWRGGEPCRWMRQQLDNQIEKIDPADCHGSMRAAHNELIRLGSEGHAGCFKAVDEYNKAWHEIARGKRSFDEINGEIKRSVEGVLKKIKPKWTDLVMDSCQIVASGGWIDADDEAIAAGDYGGLGPVIGPMELGPTKPANEYGLHDDGNGEHLIDMYGSNIKYVDGRDDWVIWSGGRWHKDTNGRDAGLAFRRVRWAQEQFVSDLRLARAANPKDKAVSAALREWSMWAKRSGNVSGIKNALDRAAGQYVRGSDERVAMHSTKFDANPKLIGCKNGIVELDNDCSLREPRKEDYVTYNTNVNYVPWDTEIANQSGLLDSYKLWLEYLDLFIPDPHPEIPDYRQFVQKVLGYCLVGANPEKLLIFLYGPHDTGKSTLLGAIKGALGDYYGQIDQSLFSPRPLNPGLIRAVPLRVTGMSEIEYGKMDGSTIKRLTGNDTVTAEAKFSNQIFQGRPQFTTLIACNNEPNISNADEALKERILILPFETQVARNKRMYSRQTDLENLCGEAVFAWLIEGWKMYLREGLKRSTWPKLVRDMCGEVTDNFNSTQTFVSDNLESWTRSKEGIRAQQRAVMKAMSRGVHVPSPADWDEDWTPSAERVYAIYVNWCAANRVVPPLSSIQFTKQSGLGRALQRWNPERRKNEKRYVGWRIRLDGGNDGDTV